MEKRIHRAIYNNLHRLIGMPVGREYFKIRQEDGAVPVEEITRRLLVRMLSHCEQKVPYYAEFMRELGGNYAAEPEIYLRQLPILTKDNIRSHFQELTSSDLADRKWFYNTSGGSTGEPVRLIQDKEFAARTGAIQWLSNLWAGRDFGERGVRIWGSERDILQGSMGLKMSLVNWMTNDTWMNAFRMTPATMRKFIQDLNAHPPQLIIAYAQSIYELAQFAEQSGARVVPQKAILTSAGTLHPFMRAQIEKVFQCRVFNRYGSREVGDIACECEAHAGLHVFPWSCYVEVVDEQGRPAPAGVDGNILVTCLTNYAMPLIRYSIGDRGILTEGRGCTCGRDGQILEKVTGRNTDVFLKADGTLIDGEYFTHLIYFRGCVKQFQVIQTGHQEVIYRIVKTSPDCAMSDSDEIIEKTKGVMGEDCRVEFEFVDDIPPSASGKYRYTISEITPA